jgi:hypothetical protein
MYQIAVEFRPDNIHARAGVRKLVWGEIIWSALPLGFFGLNGTHLSYVGVILRGEEVGVNYEVGLFLRPYRLMTNHIEPTKRLYNFRSGKSTIIGE